MVFDTIGGANGISRAKIADLTGLGAPMVTMITRTLIAKGLVREGDPERGRRGQPARPLMVDPDGGYAFGVTFTRLITTGLLDLTGNIRAEASEQVEHFSGAVLQRSVRTLITRLQRRCRIDPKRVLGIGINVPATASEPARLLPYARLFRRVAGHRSGGAAGRRPPLSARAGNRPVLRRDRRADARRRPIVRQLFSRSISPSAMAAP